jgi:hypothetical protein
VARRKLPRYTLLLSDSGFCILENMNGRLVPSLALLSLVLSTGRARADEIRLKDGTKISGTIVGFENGSFRVQTSYGFALIEKDKVADINITAPKKEAEPKTKSDTPVAQTAPAAPAETPTTPKESVPAASVTPRRNAPQTTEHPSTRAIVSAGSPVAVKTEAPLSKATVASVTPASAPPALPAAPVVPSPTGEPPVIHDEIRGNEYVNLTYGFKMYKPPSWDLIPDARKALPDAVAALGTSDQTTLLVIGLQHSRDSLEAHANSAAKVLSAVYDNYRLISSRRVEIAGLAAIEQRSRGTADGRDWSVILLTFLRGKDVYTMLGMTWADSDLIQVEENVISKTVSSITFTAQ